MILLKKTTLPYDGRKWPVLMPSDSDSWEALHKVKESTVLACEAKRARSAPQHRLFFAVLHKVFENQSATDFKDFDNFRKALLIEAGFWHPIIRISGTVVPEADSLSFHNMPQDRFQEVFNKVMDIVCEMVMPGLDREDFLAHFEGYAALLGGSIPADEDIDALAAHNLTIESDWRPNLEAHRMMDSERYIAKLEAQLAEKDKELERLRGGFCAR